MTAPHVSTSGHNLCNTSVPSLFFSFFSPFICVSVVFKLRGRRERDPTQRIHNNAANLKSDLCRKKRSFSDCWDPEKPPSQAYSCLCSPCLLSLSLFHMSSWPPCRDEDDRGVKKSESARCPPAHIASLPQTRSKLLEGFSPLFALPIEALVLSCSFCLSFLRSFSEWAEPLRDSFQMCESL